MQAGDIALHRPNSDEPAGWWICAFTRSRFCHVRLITGPDGGTVEANFGGPSFRARVQDGDVVISIPLSDGQRVLLQQNVDRYLGKPYGLLDIMALGLASFGLRWKWLRNRIGRTDRLICSQLVDLAWTDVGFHMFTDGRLPQDVNPGDIADQAQSAGYQSYTYKG